MPTKRASFHAEMHITQLTCISVTKITLNDRQPTTTAAVNARHSAMPTTGMWLLIL